MCLSIFRKIYLCVFLTTCIIAKRSIGIRTRVSVMKVFHLFGNTLYYLLPQQSVLCCDHLDKYEQEQVQLDAYHAPVRYTNVHVCISHKTLHIRFVFRVIAFSFAPQVPYCTQKYLFSRRVASNKKLYICAANTVTTTKTYSFFMSHLPLLSSPTGSPVRQLFGWLAFVCLWKRNSKDFNYKPWMI